MPDIPLRFEGAAATVAAERAGPRWSLLLPTAVSLLLLVGGAVVFVHGHFLPDPLQYGYTDAVNEADRLDRSIWDGWTRNASIGLGPAVAGAGLAGLVATVATGAWSRRRA